MNAQKEAKRSLIKTKRKNYKKFKKNKSFQETEKYI